MASNVMVAIAGSVTSGTLAGFGAVVSAVGRGIRRNLDENRQALENRLDDIETGMTRTASQLLQELGNLRRNLEHLDRRVTRLESWRDLVTLPDDLGRRRRTMDAREGEDDGG